MTASAHRVVQHDEENPRQQHDLQEHQQPFTLLHPPSVLLHSHLPSLISRLNPKGTKRTNNMTIKDDPKKEEEDIVISDAIPAPSGDNTTGPPVPSGHNRFYCESCRTPYDLPQNATSWRCARCSTFNSITPAECPMCAIL